MPFILFYVEPIYIDLLFWWGAAIGPVARSTVTFARSTVTFARSTVRD